MLSKRSAPVILCNCAFCFVPQQTRNIGIIFVQRQTNIFDVGPTLHKCYTNILCLLRGVYSENELTSDVFKMVLDQTEARRMSCEYRGVIHV